MKSKKNLKRNLLICLLAGSAVMYTLPLHAATSVIGNGTLPSGGQFFDGKGFTQGTVIENGHNFEGIGSIIKPNDLTMNVHQNNQNAVIKWDSFNVGGSATVNFKGPQVEGGYNTLNYVNAGGSMSQIYGTINANNNGNIFIVNPAGVQIGNSAQINVGSLYVSNKNLDNVNWKKIDNVNPDINSIMGQGTTGDAVLMSLGNINAGEVTFEGNGRIVIDSERIKDAAGDEKLNYQNINIKTSETNKNNIIIGYEAYDETITNGSVVGYDNKNTDEVIATVTTENGTSQYKKANGYMWVEDVEQLQAIGKNANTLSGNYALRNSIDATSTANWNEVNGTYAGFNPIGLDETTGKVLVNNNNEYGFTGNFDGLDYNIFGLTINRESEANVGLFGVAHNANINNVTLVGGSITGGSVVGSVIGAALGNTHITNATNSASVTGNTDVGGIVGYSGDDIDNTQNGNISDITTDAHFSNLINTGAVHSNGEQNTNVSNAGGLIGYMFNGTLDGNSYNLGDVSGDGYNVGGLVGHAVNSTIGDGTNLVYNRMDVTGAYNVGGIVGNMTASTVRNAENSGTVLASGSLTDKYNYHTDIANENNLPAGSSLSNGIVSIDVNVANAGGIAGSSSDSSIIKDVTNTGDVSSRKQEGTENINGQNYNYEYYTAGNVGGIVGSAADTNITNATNRENEIRGAHNVGGIAGYFSGTGTIDNIDKGINDGGDIMATGARNGNGFVMESVRQSGDEDFIIGNIGGIVGYMDGKGVKVTGSANRGTVHTENIEDADNVLTISKAANVGGIVGKIDANTNETGLLSDFRNGNYKNASVSKSYNTGNVTGYTGVGGVIGMMYNGSVAGSYNQGAINTTRQVYRGGGGYIDPLNMGGIVGDTTEQTSASAVIYDVYNEGQIGDEDFEFYARHVGGIVGRLSGTVEKAYNTGDIYNNDTAVGGIVGWWYNGNIKNVFNTGNITVRSATELQVGGIAGAAAGGVETLENAYNLGTIRGYKEGVDASNNPINGTDDYIYVGGIIGRARGGNALTIRNVYTMGNLYAGVGTYNNATGTYSYELTKTNGLGAIYGGNEEPTLEGANYIKPDSNYFKDLSNQRDVNDISYSDRYKKDKYKFVNVVGTTGDIIFDQEEESGAVEGATDDNWRIYEDSTTPILNAFLPNVKDYFANNNNMTNISTIQYGTAYNPLLTIIKATGDLSYDWKKLGISGAASLAVYGGGLTLDNVDTSGGTGYYSGLLYTDKDLTLIATNKNNEPDATKVSGDIGLGSGAELYGSSVKIEADGTVTVYGSVTATGETAGSTGDINITAGDVDVYGTLTTGKPVSIAGIEGSAQKVDTNFENVNNPNEAMIHISERFAHEIDSANGATNNITINAGTKLVVGDDGNPILDKDGNEQYVNIGNGNVNLYFGNKEQGLITTSGNLTVTGTGDVYVDSDLDIGGNLTLTGNGENSEVVLDLTNIGQVQAKNELAENPNSNVTALDKFHDFMHHFGSQIDDDNQQIMLNAKISGDAKLTIDMWDKTQNNGQGGYNLNKYDQNTGHDLVTELNNLNINADIKTNNGTIGNVTSAKPITYIWVSDGDQLQAINNNGVNGLSYNYALKNDINASDVTGYEAIGGTTGFTGTFDGRGNRIIGLDTTKDDNGTNTNFMANAGIFSTIGEGGTVKNVNIYSGNFTGTAKAGAVAGENNGRIEGVVTFGNTVTVTGEGGNAGGIVGVNNGNNGKIVTNEDGTITLEPVDDELPVTGIIDVESTGSVIAGGSSAVAGGLVGTNDGALGNSYSNSAVTANKGTGSGLGGVVGVNTANGNVQYVDSLGVTNGGAHLSNNVGGIIGINNGNMYSGYNESIVSGSSNVGGIIGTNAGTYNEADKKWESGTVSNVVNATSVTSDAADSKNVGGLVGTNTGSVTNGRNNGTITGTKYVGGIAGSNSGTITADEKNDNLINRGSITGNKYVGGVAGENKDGGTIANTLNSVVLHAKGDNAQYFGGVVGQNSGLINGATNTSDIDITAVGGTYVGGIIGENTQTGTLQGEIRNKGSVAGKSQVGGIIGKNDNNKVLQGKEENRLIVTNDGTVDAEDGGAAGIFYENNGEIKYADISNNGVVNGGDKTGGTGGLFGINTGNITESTLANSGTVIGGGIVGGLIGKNSGDVSNSSLTNTGSVIGTSDVGGLIGYNTGTIIGGRNEAQETDEDGNVTAEEDSYYKYKVYNNGTITVTGSGSNIGGLIGENATGGSLTAGYNTGAINAENSSNVGGIVGNNAGKVDQVFNTVMTPEGEGAITGGNNVGGLIGTNSGTLSNAYNTTEVKPTNSGVVGNAVGENSGTITNIYAANTTGHLIGSGYDKSKVTNAYSFVSNDASATEVISETADTDNDGITDRIDSDSYDGFDFTNGTWKNYDGSGNPLLKVFLTTVKVDTDDLPNLVYNTKDQDLNIDGLTGVNGAFSAADDFTAYENNNSLIQNTGFEHKNAGTYDNWLYSQQIASGSQDGTFNPNNLGYDIELTHDIDKAQITVDLNEVERTYGDTTILNNGNYNYSYDFANVTDETDLANLRNELNNNDVLSLGNVDKTKDDGGLVEDGTKTNNAGDYNWTGTVNIADGYQGNYEFVLTTEQSNDNQSSLGTNGTSITTIGDSIVNAKTITLGDFLATIVYGNQNNEFTYSGYEDWLEDQLVYGDHIGLSFSGATTGGAYETDKGNRDTADVGTYTDSITANVALTNNEKGNYVIESGSVTGDILVTPAQLDIVLGDVRHVYGSPNLNDYEANANGLVNGDNGSISVNVDSVTDGALSTDKQYTDDVGNYYWTVGNGGLNAKGFDLGNYTINYVNQGDSEVIQANLTININDVNMTYGDLESWISGQYGYSASDIDGQKLVNGDSLADVIAGMTYNNTAYNSDETTKNVADGNFALTSDGVTQGTKYGNYNITFNNGTVTMDKKQITIGANDEQILVGETPNYSGTDINGVLVNGDSLNDNYHYGVEDSSIESVVGTHNGAIGVWIGGSFYDLSNPDWSNLPGMSFFANYNVTFEPGTLTVSAYDIPEDWPHNRWDYLFNDAPFDRNENFRERKAEVNFVDGAMEI